MGWFSEQIEQRKKQDNEVFGDSFIHLAGAVIGNEEAAAAGGGDPDIRDAIHAVQRYFGIQEKRIPLNMTEFDERLAYIFRPAGVMYRHVKLEKGWYKEAYGPMLSRRTDNGEPIALLPKGDKYFFYDAKGNRRVYVDKKTETLISGDALLFYQPFTSDRMNVRALLRYMVRQLGGGDILMLAGAALSAVLAGMLIPTLIRRLFSQTGVFGSHAALIAIAVFMICAETAAALFGVIREMQAGAIYTKLSHSVEAAAMMRTLSLPAAFFKKYSAGDLANRIDQLRAFCQKLVNSVLTLGLTGIFSLVYIWQIFIYTPSLAAAAVCITAVTAMLSLITTLWQTRVSRRRMEYAAQGNGIGYALISGIQKIRLAGAEKRAFARWANIYAREARTAYAPPMFLRLNTALTMAVSLGGAMALYYLAVKTRVAMADYYAFNSSYALVQTAFLSLSGAALTAADAKPILDMFGPILEAKPEVSIGKQTVTKLSGRIELSNVTFSYRDDMPPVIDGLTLDVEPGQYVAIVGETGCGKSTLMRLLLGFEKPQRGAVYYDGVDLERIDAQSLRRRIGTVMQNGRLFSGDIYSNIAISAPGLSLDEAWQAAETAGIADDIRQMPMGMHTLISEGAGDISGGQRQRLLIARAIAATPAILMFDEATSALDNITQKKVSDALNSLKCTRIVIAHRLSTIMQCDRIIVLDKGRIAEDGTYSELLEKDGIFASLVKRQQLDKM